MALSQTQRQAAYKLRHPGRVAEVARRSTTKKLQFVFDYKRSKGCGVCRETDPVVLELHHLGEKTRNAGHSTRWTALSWEQLRAEVPTCDVLCANCHRRHTATVGGWHEGVL